MNTSNKEQAPEQDAINNALMLIHRGFLTQVDEIGLKEASLKLCREAVSLQQRISQLEQERKQIASDAWRAAVTWEHWHYYEEIYGKLMPKDMRNNRPPQLHEYLSRFEQTKAENI